jgi:ATP-dependent helicase/nuclease subunit A
MGVYSPRPAARPGPAPGSPGRAGGSRRAGPGRRPRLDRVVEFDEAVWLIDNKTGDDSRGLADDQLVERHQPQLSGYRTLLAALYPGKPVRAALLLADGRLVDMTSG